jgi:hypothetical protein
MTVASAPQRCPRPAWTHRERGSPEGESGLSSFPEVHDGAALTPSPSLALPGEADVVTKAVFGRFRNPQQGGIFAAGSAARWTRQSSPACDRLRAAVRRRLPTSGA